MLSAGARARSAPLPRAPRGYSVALAALSGAGIAVSAYLTYAHQRLINEPGWESFCAISTSLNCDTVITSPFGTLVGVPLSALVLWFYLLIGTLAASALTRRRWALPQSPTVLLLAAGAVATLVSAGLAAVSAFWIGAWCLLCIVLYAANVGILVVAWRAFRLTGEDVPNRLAEEWRYWRRHRAKTARAIGMAVAALAGVIFASTRDWGGSSSVCRAVAGVAPDAPITVVVYSDFQCPACRRLNGALRRLRDHPRLRIVDQHFPLDRACNPSVKRGPHPGACLQARAAICAAAQQQETAFSDDVFRNDVRDESSLSELAGTLGLDRARFDACLKSSETAKRLEDEIGAAIDAGVHATPTVFVNGQQDVGSLSSEDLACLAAT